MNARHLRLMSPYQSRTEFSYRNFTKGAVYVSLERQQLDAPQCRPNIRVAIINRLAKWGGVDSNALLLWLDGAVGAGKSAMAHSSAEICEKCGYLLATFFLLPKNCGGT